MPVPLQNEKKTLSYNLLEVNHHTLYQNGSIPNNHTICDKCLQNNIIIQFHIVYF